MKTQVQVIKVELRWQFVDGATCVRSNVVGGYQAEVDGKNVRVYHRSGELVLNTLTPNRKEGMKLAGYRIGRLIQGEGSV